MDSCNQQMRRFFQKKRNVANLFGKLVTDSQYLLGDVIRKQKIKNLVKDGKHDEKRTKGRERDKHTEVLAKRLNHDKNTNLICSW